MEYVVDVQGFKAADNEFVFKEVAIAALEDDPTPSVYSFKSPYRWDNLPSECKSTNRWLELNYHGIPWSSGEIPYTKLVESVQYGLINAKKVYVKGLEKKRWLQGILLNM